MSRVRINILANLAGQIWSVALGLIAVPLYVRFMGAESYGLVGLFATLTNLISLLDIGLSSTMNRELARYSVLADKAQEMRDLVRTLESLYWGIGIAIGVGVVALAPFIAHNWVQAQVLPIAVVQQAVTIMGLLAAVQWPLSFYGGGLMGLQRQVTLNAINAGSVTLHVGGALLILWLVSPTVTAFFVWRIVVGAIQVGLTVWALWRHLPKGDRAAHFRWPLLRSVWHFAAGTSGVMLVSMLLTQLDKIILSRLLTLEMFGYYTLAGVVANSLFYLVGPFFKALFPKFSERVALDDQAGLRELYHHGCQWISVMVLPVAVVLAFFAPEALRLWTGNPATVANTYVLVRLLVIGNALNGLMNLPYALQLAHGWTKLAFYKNVVACVILVPAIVFSTTRYGAVGAAAIWVLLNSGYALVEIPIMHRRLLPGEQWRWYLEDVSPPLILTLAIAAVARGLMDAAMPPVATLAWLAAAYGLALSAAVVAAPQVRAWVMGQIRRVAYTH